MHQKCTNRLFEAILMHQYFPMKNAGDGIFTVFRRISRWRDSNPQPADYKLGFQIILICKICVSPHISSLFYKFTFALFWCIFINFPLFHRIVHQKCTRFIPKRSCIDLLFWVMQKVRLHQSETVLSFFLIITNSICMLPRYYKPLYNMVFP